MNPIASLFTEANSECINDSELITSGNYKAVLYYFEMSRETFDALKIIGHHGWTHVQKKKSDPSQTFQMAVFGEVLVKKDKHNKFLDECMKSKIMGCLSFTSDLHGDKSVCLNCLVDNSLTKGKAILRKKLIK